MKKLEVRNRYLLLVDILLCSLAYMLVLLVGYETSEMVGRYVGGLPLVMTATFVYVLVFLLGNLYKTDWVNASVKEYGILISVSFLAGIINTLIGYRLCQTIICPKVNGAANVTAIAFVCALRFFVRFADNLASAKKGKGIHKTLVIGAGRLAVMFLREIAKNPNMKYDVVGLVDDDKSKNGMRICGTRVLGNRNNIVSICEQKNVEEIVFAISSILVEEKREILDICSTTGCKVKILPAVAEMLGEDIDFKKIRDVKIEDLLERDPIKLDNRLISDEICDKTVIITGGGGSIGSELCRQIVKYNPKKIIILDVYENTSYELQNELEDEYGAKNVDVIIASVRDKKRLDEIFEKYRPDCVFHAAAHKHVPLMETSPGEAVKNNVFGTYNVACCAVEHGVSRFVMISTDKAVNPTNVMGATKRICEMIIQAFSKNSKTEFVAVRFGNVLGSHGSVVPRFEKQIAHGGPVTVTHPEVTRFFMTIPEAAQLVLQAAAYAKGGEIFVLDMGEPVKIYDMAKKLIQLSGLRVHEDIEIEIVGLREGEKLYEELLMDEEGLKETAHSKIFVGQPINISMDELKEKLSLLEGVLDKDVDEIKNILKAVVPTYSPAEEK